MSTTLPIDEARRIAGMPGDALQLFAVAAAPFAWALQLVVNYAISAYPCFERHAARMRLLPGWEGERALLLAINVAAIAVVVLGGALGLRAMRWARAQSMRDAQGDRAISRTYALGAAAVLFAVIFLLATVFALIAASATPACPE